MERFEQLRKAEDSATLKGMSEEELTLLSHEIRQYLCEKVLVTGGHLASNLGVVELTLALHRVFDLPHDHLIFDVGHQCYTHKLLTGRRESFDALRKRGGLSGFTKREESQYDCFGAGHSSTSVSAAIGFAEAERMRGSDAYTVAVLGDGAFTGGMIHEALNNCRRDLKLIIVLNENEMSISRNTGAFASLIAKIRASKGYYRTKRRTVKVIRHLPLIGQPLFRLVRAVKQSIKDKLYKSNYFEDLGLYYLGPADGHNIQKVERLLREAKNAGQSTVIHLRTVKGKGYAPAEKDPGRFHGVPPQGTPTGKNFSRYAGECLSALAEEDGRVCAVTAAMPTGTGLSVFAERIPSRFFDVGIAEEHALTFSAGLAADGFRPYFAVYSSFLQRGYDNLIHDIALQRLPVTVLVDRAGLSEGDGPTHHGIFDVAFLSQIPHMTLYTPSTFASLDWAMKASLAADGPVAIRYPNAFDNEAVTSHFTYGDPRLGVMTPEGCRTLILTYGKIVSEALRAAKELPDCGVLLLEQLKPYDTVAARIDAVVPSTVTHVIFLEEGIKNGGAGMILREKLSLPEGCIYTHLAIDDIFDSPKVTGNLYHDFGIGYEDVVSEVRSAEGLRPLDPCPTF